MTSENRPAPSPDPDHALRQALQSLAYERGVPDADVLGRRVMLDWRREVGHSAGAAQRFRLAGAASGFQRHGRRRMGVTAVVAGVALLLVLWVKLHDVPPQSQKQIDVLTQISFGGL